MDNSILQEALALPADDRLELAERIRESLVAGGSAREPGECPRCGCSHVARRGRDADGVRRPCFELPYLHLPTGRVRYRRLEDACE